MPIEMRPDGPQQQAQHILDPAIALLVAQAILAKATKLARLGRYAAAEELVRPLMNSNEARAATLDLLSRLYAQQGRLSEARSHWTLALEADPANESARAGLRRIESIHAHRWRPKPLIPVMIVLAPLGLVLVGGFYLLHNLNSLHRSVLNGIAQVSQKGPSSASADIRSGEEQMKHAQSPEELGTEAGKKTTETMGALANALHNAGMIVTKEGETILAVFDTGLFTSGTALSPQGEAQLSKVGRLLKPHDRFLIVRISGCTDDIPVRPGSVYYDNIALGYARAVAAAEYLRRGPSLPANMFVILSPDNAPLFPNDSSVNRRKNRTVKLCISFAEPSAL